MGIIVGVFVSLRAALDTVRARIGPLGALIWICHRFWHLLEALLGPFLGPWGRALGYIFVVIFWVPSQNDFWVIYAPKRRPQKEPLETIFAGLSENLKTLIFETPHAV